MSQPETLAALQIAVHFGVSEVISVGQEAEVVLDGEAWEAILTQLDAAGFTVRRRKED